MEAAGWKETQALFIAFAKSCGINTPTMTVLNIPEYLTISHEELDRHTPASTTPGSCVP